MNRPRPNIHSINSAIDSPKAIVRRVAPEYKFQKKIDGEFKFQYCDQSRRKSPLKGLNITKQKNHYMVEFEALCDFSQASKIFNPMSYIFKLEKLGFEQIESYKPEKGAKLYYQRNDVEEGELEKILVEINS